MDEFSLTTEQLIKLQKQKKQELDSLGETIKKSSKEHVVMFLDLCNSTKIKHELAPEEWLGYISEFINIIQKLVVLENGNVIKRIGDEVMINFSNIQDSESFINKLTNDESLSLYRYKGAVDFGESYFFKFDGLTTNDPYGQIVDRCARLTSLASENILLCSEDYVNKLDDVSICKSFGDFSLKGITQKQEVFLRAKLQKIPDSYLDTLKQALEDSSKTKIGYDTVPRKFDSNYFNILSTSSAKPFIASELLNVMKLHYTPDELLDKIKQSIDSDVIKNEFIGKLVEWSGKVESLKTGSNSVAISIKTSHIIVRICLELPIEYSNLNTVLNEDDIVNFRGILLSFSITCIHINYVDILSIEKNNNISIIK